MLFYVCLLQGKKENIISKINMGKKILNPKSLTLGCKRLNLFLYSEHGRFSNFTALMSHLSFKFRRA